jgi:excinuclease ABC subunit C
MVEVKITEIPDNPGVYTFINEEGKIIYVGKAKSLRKRVKSYFNNQNSYDPKRLAMLRAARDIKFIVTKNEVEAFLLEANLIKNEKPRYNVMLKDSKGYPYIKLTDEKFARLEYTRNISDRKATYYGPFIDASGLKEILRELQRIFLLRSCNNNRFNQRKLCLKYQIKQCSGPCENKITEEEYAVSVDRVKEFFKGNTGVVKKDLIERMNGFVQKLQFEDAAAIRDKLNSLETLFSKQDVIYKVKNKTVDGFVFHYIENTHGLTQFFIRSGKLISIKTMFFDFLIDNDFAESTILQFYNKVRQFPDGIIIYSDNKNIDIPLLRETLFKLSGRQIQVTEKYAKNNIIAFVLKNATVQTQLYVRKKYEDVHLLSALARSLCMSTEPRKIECIDISHISGTSTVGVSINYTNGEFNKNLYKRYRIRTASNDDYKAIYELMYRKGENIIGKTEEIADLYIIDGGRGQLNAAVQAFRDLNIENAQFISIAKGRNRDFKPEEKVGFSVEEVYLYGRKNKMNFKKDDPVLLFIQRLRDEAHRFAINYSRKVHLKSIDTSPLKKVQGLGPIRLKRILLAFPDIYINKEITEYLLVEKCNIPLRVAKDIISYLREKHYNLPI